MRIRELTAGVLMVIADDLLRLADYLDPVEEPHYDTDGWPQP
jgi:hypothetical protein